MSRKCRFSPRAKKNIDLANAIVWTLMVPAWLDTYFDRRHLAELGYVTSTEVGMAGLMVVCSVGLAIAWWVQWVRFDKKNRNDTD